MMLKFVTPVSQLIHIYNIRTIQSFYGIASRFSSLSCNDNSSESDSEIAANDIENMVGIENNVGYQLSFIRNDYNQITSDPLMISIRNCASVEDVLKFVKLNKNSLKPYHINRSMLLLWDLQKIYYCLNTTNSAKYVQPNVILNNYFIQLHSHEDFKLLLEITRKNYEQFNIEELTSTLLYLTKMGINSSNIVYQLIHEKCKDTLNIANTFSISALANYCIAIGGKNDLCSIVSYLNVLPLLYKELDHCDNDKSLKLITICLQNVSNVVTKNLVQIYVNKAQQILITANEENVGGITKAISFLNHPQWFHSCFPVIRKFILLLKDRVNLLNEQDFIALHKAFQNIHEPANMFNEIQRHATKLLMESRDSSNSTTEKTLQLLICVAVFAAPLQRKKFEKVLNKYINIPLNLNTFVSINKIISRLKITDKDIIIPFWNNVLQLLNDNPEYRKKFLLMKVCNIYLKQHKESRGMPRSNSFEAQIMKWIDEECKLGIANLLPSKFSKYAAFVIAFGKSDDNFNCFQENIKTVCCQLKSSDCLIILKGLSICNRKNIIEDCLYSQVNTLLMKDNNINFNETSSLLKCNIYLHKNNNKVLENFLVNYELDNALLSSRIVQDITFTLQNSDCLLPNLIDQLTNYIVQNQEYVFATTCEKLLCLIYHLAYFPKNGTEFFEAASNAILRDQERLSGLAFLQSALSLCYFNNLSESIIKQVFCAPFLEKLDRELDSCYSKEVYPIRVRNCLMQLNRAVCFDYPNANVPWFHKKYIDEVIRKDQSKPSSPHFSFVEQVLNKVLGPKHYISDVFTPYGYHIDFVICFDDNNKPLMDQNVKENARKIAILLMNSNAYTNVHENLIGKYQLKKRHLEILGYHVFVIDYKLWKMLYSPQEKIGFIQNILLSLTV